ncbi:hypothetical protein HON41_02920, partial [bacterium]|nr:hypothetical protein [bacterium]
PDIVQALEMGSNFAKFQGALNAVHIHFHPEGFSSKEVQSANKEYRKRFSKGLLLKTFTKEHPVLGSSKIGNVKLNKALDVDTQEALVLTANRLLAIRTDLENVKLIDRALVYVELANNNRSGEKAQTYLDTAEAMHKALNDNQAYTPFLNQESLPSNASVEVQQSLLESCRQQEQELITPCDNEVKIPELECGVPEVKTPEVECGTEIPEDNTGFKESRCGGGVNQRPEPEFQGPCIVGDQVPEPLHMPKQTLPPLHGPDPNKGVKADDQEGAKGAVEDKVETEIKVDSEQDEEVVEGEKASGKADASNTDIGEEGAYIGGDRAYPEAQLDLDAAVEQWSDVENVRWVEEVVADHLQSASIPELIEEIQPFVDYFNSHPVVKKLGIYIDAEKLVQHMTQGEILQGDKQKRIAGVHDALNATLLDNRSEWVDTKTHINHGETEGYARPIDPELRSDYKIKETIRFGSDFTYERILKIILDAIENGRGVDPRKESDHAGKVHIITRCGMKIEIRVEKGGRVCSIYPVKEWLNLEKNQVKCDGRCYKELG